MGTLSPISDFPSLESTSIMRLWPVPSRIPEKSTSIPAKIVRQWASALLLVLASLFACGQDTRNVTEPHIPAICSTLDAILSSHNGNLREEDEARLDTARIQE